jgi:hypothetical protein
VAVAVCRFLQEKISKSVILPLNECGGQNAIGTYIYGKMDTADEPWDDI